MLAATATAAAAWLLLLPILSSRVAAVSIGGGGDDTLQSCQDAADAFCNTPASGNGTAPCAAFQPAHCQKDRYVARLGRGSPDNDQLALQWRCFAESVAANASNTNFATECYCTHHEQLQDMLTECQQRVAPAVVVFSSSHPPPPLVPGTPPCVPLGVHAAGFCYCLLIS
jgi:hypothetical protein